MIRRDPRDISRVWVLEPEGQNAGDATTGKKRPPAAKPPDPAPDSDTNAQPVESFEQIEQW